MARRPPTRKPTTAKKPKASTTAAPKKAPKRTRSKRTPHAAPDPATEAPRGRPTVLTEPVRKDILERIAVGEPLRSICRDETMPARQTIYRALGSDEVFRAAFEASKKIGLEALADDLLDLADDGSADPQRSKLQIDTRKWLLAKLLPKEYGEKVAAEVSGPDGAPIKVEDLSPVEIARRLAFVLAQGRELLRKQQQQ